ncbi:MAG: copper chaperone PCu(A)C [Rhodospirillales bacterium]|nr:copper chaperone PCu(A)C [Rhodospirillales bacterium]
MKFELSALALAAALSFAPAAWAHEYKLGNLTIDHPWARASVAANGAAYMIIGTSADTPDQLVAATSPAAGKVELHTHIVEGDIMRMRPVKAIEINPGEPAVLKPGGLHVMLIGLKAPLKEGEKFPLTLTFEKAGTVTVDVIVQGAGAGLPEHMGEHQH